MQTAGRHSQKKINVAHGLHPFSKDFINKYGHKYYHTICIIKGEFTLLLSKLQQRNDEKDF